MFLSLTVLLASSQLHTAHGNARSSRLAESRLQKSATKVRSHTTGDRKGDNNNVLSYRPSDLEDYVFRNLVSLGYNTTEGEYAKGCEIWKKSRGKLSRKFKTFLKELDAYSAWVDQFDQVSDIRSVMRNDSLHDCENLQQGKDWRDFFSNNSLSFTSSGALEPLLPPMRHPGFCIDGKHLMSTSYLVHDFESICKDIRENSRTVFFDLGASLGFHSDGEQPAVSLIKLYQKFGITFDHIYAYELTPGNAGELYKSLPAELLMAYHWINAGVEVDPASALNPLKMIIENFSHEDFVVLKLDVDNPEVELSLVKQIIENDALTGLIDQFYFEHHVHLEELHGAWGPSVRGSVSDSLLLFQKLRTKGIQAHFWV